MKQWLLAFGLLTMCLTTPLKAIGGIGVYGLQGQLTIDGERSTFDFQGASSTIDRTMLENPVGIGGFLYIDLLPFIDLEAGFEVLGGFYDYTYSYSLYGITETTNYQDLPWARAAGYLSIQKPIFKLPMFKIYAGGGVNISQTVPIVDEEFLTEYLPDPEAIDELDPDLIVEELGSETGFHVELGARIKPILIPFSLNAKARYNFVGDSLPGISGYPSLSLGLAFAL